MRQGTSCQPYYQVFIDDYHPQRKTSLSFHLTRRKIYCKDPHRSRIYARCIDYHQHIDQKTESDDYTHLLLDIGPDHLSYW